MEGGACGCCGLETLVDSKARLQILYRAAGAMIHRDAMWMTIGSQGAPAPVRLQSWELPACPMTTFPRWPSRRTASSRPRETRQQIYSAVLKPDSGEVSTITPVEGSAIRKHPSVAINAAGDRLIAWTEGTAWARAGTVAWELRDRSGVTLAAKANAGTVPVWGLVSALVRKDGSFLILH